METIEIKKISHVEYKKYTILFDIHKGLSSFYHDFCLIKANIDLFKATSHILGHCMREFFSCLRNCIIIKDEKNNEAFEKEFNVHFKKIAINNPDRKNIYSKNKGNLKSIYLISKTIDSEEVFNYIVNNPRILQLDKSTHSSLAEDGGIRPIGSDESEIMNYFEEFVDILTKKYDEHNRIINLVNDYLSNKKGNYRELFKTKEGFRKLIIQSDFSDLCEIVNKINNTEEYNTVYARYEFLNEFNKKLNKLVNKAEIKDCVQKVFVSYLEKRFIKDWRIYQKLFKLAHFIGLDAQKQLCEKIIDLDLLTFFKEDWQYNNKGLIKLEKSLCSSDDEKIMYKGFELVKYCISPVLTENKSDVTIKISEHAFAMDFQKFAKEYLISNHPKKSFNLFKENLIKAFKLDYENKDYHRLQGSRYLCEYVSGKVPYKLYMPPVPIIDVYITLLRLACEKIITTPEKRNETVNEFLKEDFFIFHRIAMYLLTVARSDKKLDITFRILSNRQYLEESEFENEYRELLEKKFHRFTKKQQKDILNMIANPPDSFDKEKHKRYWQFELLFRIRKYLSGDWKKRYKELKKEFGKPDDRPMTDFKTGPNSPAKLSKVLSWSDRTLKQKMKSISWVDEWEMISPDGFGRMIMLAVQHDPKRFTANRNLFKDIHPLYVRYFFDGLEHVIREEKVPGGKAHIKSYEKHKRSNADEINWENVIWIIKRIITSPWEIDEKINNVEQLGEQSWNKVRIESLRLIVLAFNNHLIDEPLVEKCFDVISKCAENEEEMVQFEMLGVWNMIFYSEPATTLETLIYYCFEYRRFFNLEEGFSNIPNAIDVFEKLVDKKTQAVSAVLGMNFMNIYMLDREWLFSNIHKVFPRESEKRWIAAWLSYVHWNWKVNEKIIENLHGEFIHMFHIIREWREEDKRTVLQDAFKIAFTAYALGILTLDDEIFEKAFEFVADDDELADAINWSIFRIFEDYITLKDKHSKMEEYWDKRFSIIKENPNEHSKELLNYPMWFFNHGKTSDEWALDRLEKGVDLGSVSRFNFYSFGRRLAKLAENENYINQCLNICVKYLKSSPHDIFSNPNKEIDTILENGLKCNMQSEVQRIIDMLISRGMNEYIDWLEKHDTIPEK